MIKNSRWIVLALALSVLLGYPAALLAGEHGGTEMKEHGGMAMMEGSHGHHAHEHGDEDVEAIREAATLLKATHPELALKLEKIAEKEEEEEEESMEM